MLRSVSVLATILTLSTAGWAEEPNPPVFEKDLAKALAASRETGRPVLLYVHDSV